MCKSPAEKAKLFELSELSELELEGMFLFDPHYEYFITIIM